MAIGLQDYQQLPGERHAIVCSVLDYMFRTFASKPPDTIPECANTALIAIKRFLDLLHKSGQPQWALELRSELESYEINAKDDDFRLQIIHRLIAELLPQVKAWTYDPDVEEAVDIDRLLAKHLAASEIDAKFVEIVKILETLLESGKIDSNSAIGKLKRLIAIVKENRKGTLNAQLFSWNVVTKFTGAFAKEPESPWWIKGIHNYLGSSAISVGSKRRRWRLAPMS